MNECKTQPRVWRLNWSDIRSLEGRGAYLYNPKGEMVAIILEQDRPESEGITVQIMESLNAQLIASHAPASTATNEVIEKYARDLRMHNETRPLANAREKQEETLRAILTRFASEIRVDAERQKLVDELVAAAIAWQEIEPACGCGGECHFDRLHNAIKSLKAAGGGK